MSSRKCPASLWWMTGIACGVVGLALIQAQAGPSAARMIRTEGVVIVGQDGSVRGHFTAGGLTLNDSQGRLRVSIAAENDSTINLFSANGAATMQMRLSPEGASSLHMQDRRGNTRATMFLSDDGTPHITLFDRQEHRHVDIELDNDECPVLLLRGSRDAVARMSVNKYDDCIVDLEPTGRGKPRAMLLSTANGVSSADTQGADGKSQAQVWVGPDKSGHLVLLDAEGRPVAPSR